MSDSKFPNSDLTPVPAHPRHIAVVVRVGRERRPVGTSEFGGHLILHEGGDGFESDLKRIRKAGMHLVDGLIEKLRAEGWGAANGGDKYWDANGEPTGPPDETNNEIGD